MLLEARAAERPTATSWASMSGLTDLDLTEVALALVWLTLLFAAFGLLFWAAGWRPPGCRWSPTATPPGGPSPVSGSTTTRRC